MSFCKYPCRQNGEGWGEICKAGTAIRGSGQEFNVSVACAPGGGYALGTGNTVANYIPVKNYLAMLAAGNEFNGR